jgi:hypothetical protein
LIVTPRPTRPATAVFGMEFLLYTQLHYKIVCPMSTQSDRWIAPLGWARTPMPPRVSGAAPFTVLVKGAGFFHCDIFHAKDSQLRIGLKEAEFNKTRTLEPRKGAAPEVQIQSTSRSCAASRR